MCPVFLFSVCTHTHTSSVLTESALSCSPSSCCLILLIPFLSKFLSKYFHLLAGFPQFSFFYPTSACFGPSRMERFCIDTVNLAPFFKHASSAGSQDVIFSCHFDHSCLLRTFFPQLAFYRSLIPGLPLPPTFSFDSLISYTSAQRHLDYQPRPLLPASDPCIWFHIRHF